MKKPRHDPSHQLRERLQTLAARLAEYEQMAGVVPQDRDTLQRVEEVLRLREHILRTVPQGIAIVAGTQADWPIRYVNPGLERITGLAAADLLGKPAGLLLGRNPQPVAVEALRTALAQGTTWHGEVPYARTGDQIAWVEFVLAPAPSEEGAHAFVVVLTDISAQKRLETRLAQAQKMDAIGRLAGGIAHDFNNILTVILGYSEMLESGPDLAPSQVEGVAEIRKSAEWAARLTRQLLAFSRKQLLVPCALNLNAIVKDMDGLLHRLIGEDITLTYALDAELRQVRADPGQVEQVILNLAVNARDAMPQGGTLIVETSNVTLDVGYAKARLEVRPGQYVMLALSDTGAGMGTDTKSHLFEPFFTTKEPGKGTGLGLATVYGIVKQSAGYIYVYSEPGHGATFKIYLPAIIEPASADQPPRPQVERSFQGTETVLLVEDDDALRTLSYTLLKQQGYTVLPARNAGEALLSCEHQGDTIALLVTDVVMPQMSGRQLADRLTQIRPNLRVLYLSGYTQEAVHRHGLLEGDCAFVQKPFSSAELLGKVREVLDAAPAQ